MPGPCIDDWSAVRDTAVARQSITEAAKIHGVSPEAARQRARRENWPVGRRPAKALAQAKAVHSAAIAVTGGVTSVTTSDALASVMAEDERQTKLMASKAVTRRVTRLADTDDPADAQDLHTLVRSGAILYKWQADEGKAQVIVNLGFFTGDVG